MLLPMTAGWHVVPSETRIAPTCLTRVTTLESATTTAW